jgi:GDP-D-mannose 3',5'-epimerase
MSTPQEKPTLVCGAGGFIGAHLVKRLRAAGNRVRGVDLKPPAFAPSHADELFIADLRDPAVAEAAVQGIDVVYQLAADMGGAGFVFTGEHDAEIMHNSAMINLNVLEACRKFGVERVFYSSSACVYPRRNQLDPATPTTTEDSTYPAEPDSEYGWEKLFSERLYLSYARNYGLQVHIARFHNIFGPEGSWDDGREKAPAAICRKVAQTEEGGQIEIWGDGEQTRSFLYIDDCLDAVDRLMQSDFAGPVNIGSEEMVSINALAQMAMEIGGKRLCIRHVAGPLGVRGRSSDNRLIEARLGWRPRIRLRDGLERTYGWIAEQVQRQGGQSPGQPST